MQLHISFLYFAPGATKYVKFYIKSRFSMHVLPHSNESCLLDMKSLSCELYAAFVGYFWLKISVVKVVIFTLSVGIFRSSNSIWHKWVFF